MSVVVDQLVSELKALRKGRGILASPIAFRVGPKLREATGTLAVEQALDVRRKVAACLRQWAGDLPEDLELAAVAAFALDQADRLPYYKDRVRLVAERLGRDERTARRRIDEAIERLAEMAASALSMDRFPAGEHNGDWHTEELRVAVALDQPAPEAFEFRRIIADQDRIAHVDLTLTALTSTEALDVDVFHGGRLTARADRHSLRLTLPKPLRRHESHQIGLRLRVPGDWAMAPHYVWVPKHRCVEFDLRVRFDIDSPPKRVWRLVNAYQQDVEDVVPRGQKIQLDPAGEIHTSFRDLTPGLAYGIRWHPGA
jgi:hypothetical protein